MVDCMVKFFILGCFDFCGFYFFRVEKLSKIIKSCETMKGSKKFEKLLFLMEITKYRLNIHLLFFIKQFKLSFSVSIFIISNPTFSIKFLSSLM